MNVESLHGEFGARISNCNVGPEMPDSDIRKLEHAINEYSLLVLPGQSLDDERHLGFTCRFGDAEEEHVAYYSRGEITYIGKVGNIDDQGNQLKTINTRVKYQTGNEMWHSDSSFRENPSLYSILYAYEVPDEGGATAFASCRSAYDRLDDTKKNEIESLVGIHDYIFSRTKIGEDAVNAGQRTHMYPVRNRLVRKNPANGRKNFFIGSHVRDIEGWKHEEAQQLLQALLAEATRPQSVYTHHWAAGDLLIWDNRCILHRGCGYDADRYRRRMHQTRVRGRGPTLTEEI